MAKYVYMHPGQRRMYLSRARDQRLVCGRRWGKTQYLGGYMWEVADSMPRGIGIILGASRKQLFTRTVPGMMAALAAFYGFKEGVHYGWGRPPRWVPPAMIPVKTYDNAMWFANGYINHLVSLAVFGSANSLTVNNIIADECKFLNYNKLIGEVMPALSGIIPPVADERFSDNNPFYKSTCFVSDASLSNKNNWLEKEENKLDMRITEGEFAGKTFRDIQDELFHYTDRVIFYTDLLQNAEKNHHRIHEVRPEQKTLYRTIAQKMMNHEGPFAALPRQYRNMTRGMIDYCLSYHLIDEQDAEYIYDYEYLITLDEHMEMAQIMNSKKYQRHINDLQRKAFVVYRGSTLDNISLLGEEYIKRMKRDLSPLVFQISVLNQKPKRLGEGFYPNLDIENVHGYIADECPAIDSSYRVHTASHVHAGTMESTQYESPDFQYLGMKNDCTLDGDVVDTLPLHIALDYNNIINWIVTAQVYPRDHVQAMNTLSSMFVKDGLMIQDLLRQWDRYYAPHKAKNNTVFYYYNHTAKMRIYSLSGNADIKDTVIAELIKLGWSVEPVYMGQAMRHDMKYKNINEGLAGYVYPAIRINRENNEALITALENAEVRQVAGTFKKYKGGEKLSTDNADGSSVPAELRTDGTDAWDDLYIGIRFYRTGLMGTVCLPTG